MPATISINNYRRADMAAMLSALPREEQQWTWSFLNSMMFMPERYTDKAMEDIDNIPLDLPHDILMTAFDNAEKSVKNGDYISNEEIEDFVAAKMGWN